MHWVMEWPLKESEKEKKSGNGNYRRGDDQIELKICASKFLVLKMSGTKLEDVRKNASNKNFAWFPLLFEFFALEDQVNFLFEAC